MTIWTALAGFTLAAGLPGCSLSRGRVRLSWRRHAVARWLDGLTGGVLIALGLRIAFHPAQR
ncbi:MAG: hypothetical protein P8Y58_09710 [Novosphingobium sp.]